jgi:hypothetical protein
MIKINLMKQYRFSLIAISFLTVFSCTKTSQEMINAIPVDAVIAPVKGDNTSNNVTVVKKFLFDAKKGETAGNADWVIDQDNSTPQRIPTPLQSTITATTAENYWTGGISNWGIDLAKKGHIVETLPSTGTITYGVTTNTQDLKNYDVFVIVEPNIRFTTAEKQAIINFVRNGGGLFLGANHSGSDRNNDGWDSPRIWNDLFSSNGIATNPFGMSIELTNFTQISTNVLSNSLTNPLLNGTEGRVTNLSYNSGGSLSINRTANPSVQPLIWQNSTAQTSTTKIMCATCTYGTGRVFAVTDSSPIDDGTGAPNNTLYVGWRLYSHKPLFMNASMWLAKLQ